MLVSNTGQNNQGTTRDYLGQRFRTGTSPGGYTIDQICIQVAGDNTGEALLRLYSVSGGNPDSLLYTFADPAGGFAADSVNCFDAPAGGAVLKPETAYMAVLSNDAGTGNTGIEYRLTNSNSETVAANGWSIADDRNELPGTGRGSRSVKIQVRGRANADPTLSALALENPDDGSTIALNETFAAGTLTYTADAANPVDTITVTPTAAAAGASVAFLDENDAPLADADDIEPGFQLALAVGANTVKVKVTGSDAVASRTYTLTVLRANADTTLSALALENPDDDSAIDLNETFAAGTTSYTADVANAVDAITVTPTPAPAWPSSTPATWRSPTPTTPSPDSRWRWPQAPTSSR
ncbi:MAG: cadherin-like beta sandwich domain-containing protein [bacterium]|nr:cadherin-like beta sandwich domain-containing protein [bacterium]